MATFGKCTACGGKIETPWRRGLCYGCHLDSLVPRDYPAREMYAYDAVWGQINATRRPPTGVPVLDDRPGPRLSEKLLMCRRKPRLR